MELIDIEVKDIMLRHAFVGIVDISHGLSLVQHSTRLFLANHTTLAYVIHLYPSSTCAKCGSRLTDNGSEEHFYQLGLRQFGAFHRLRLDPPPLVKDLVRVGAEDEPGIHSNGLDIDHVVDVSHSSRLQCS